MAPSLGLSIGPSLGPSLGPSVGLVREASPCPGPLSGLSLGAGPPAPDASPPGPPPDSRPADLARPARQHPARCLSCLWFQCEKSKFGTPKVTFISRSGISFSSRQLAQTSRKLLRLLRPVFMTLFIFYGYISKIKGRNPQGDFHFQIWNSFFIKKTKNPRP